MAFAGHGHFIMVLHMYSKGLAIQTDVCSAAYRDSIGYPIKRPSTLHPGGHGFANPGLLPLHANSVVQACRAFLQLSQACALVSTCRPYVVCTS